MLKRGELMLNKKSQSAMEYLMTYGWAILVVLIALGALFYLGVFSPSTPNRCELPAPFVCMDMVGLDAYESATFVEDIIVLEIRIGASSVSSPTIIDINVDGEDCTLGESDINAGQPSSVYCYVLGNYNKGDKFTGTISLSYDSQYGGLTHNVDGSFSGAVEGCGSVDDCPDAVSLGFTTLNYCDTTDGFCHYTDISGE